MDFTHFDQEGNAVMVDVTEKEPSIREATAKGTIRMSKACYQKVKEGSMKKGDVLGTARLAGIMGAKKTADLIPLCHILPLTGVKIHFVCEDESQTITAHCTVRTAGRTGVEIEALTGVQVTLLTIYDMCKAVDKTMEMTGIRLCRKTGGKSGDFQHPDEIFEN